MHSIVWWIIVGLVAGALAKAVVPGENREPQGCVYTMLLGIAGSVITGFILHSILGAETSGNMIGTIIGATLGAILLILATRKYVR